MEEEKIERLRHELAVRLRDRRQYLRYSQAEVASLIGVPRGTYVQVENGRSFPTFIQLQDYARALNCSISYLFGESDEFRRSTSETEAENEVNEMLAKHLAKMIGTVSEVVQTKVTYILLDEFINNRTNWYRDETAYTPRLSPPGMSPDEIDRITGLTPGRMSHADIRRIAEVTPVARIMEMLRSE